METDELKILALTECLILWDFLAETGYIGKAHATDMLYKDRKLSSNYYEHNCPFCHYLRHPPFYACSKCPWPKHKNSSSNIRCVYDPDSPYKKWKKARGIKARMRAAKQVLNMLMSLEI